VHCHRSRNPTSRHGAGPPKGPYNKSVSGHSRFGISEERAVYALLQKPPFLCKVSFELSVRPATVSAGVGSTSRTVRWAMRGQTLVVFMVPGVYAIDHVLIPRIKPSRKGLEALEQGAPVVIIVVALQKRDCD
jgi:hypothetical protein